MDNNYIRIADTVWKSLDVHGKTGEIKGISELAPATFPDFFQSNRAGLSGSGRHFNLRSVRRYSIHVRILEFEGFCPIFSYENPS